MRNEGIHLFRHKVNPHATSSLVILFLSVLSTLDLQYLFNNFLEIRNLLNHIGYRVQINADPVHGITVRPIYSGQTDHLLMSQSPYL
jgi:hypothetical protein